MKNRLLLLPLFFASAFILPGFQKPFTTDQKKGTVKITFINTVKGNRIVLNTFNYTNPFGEQYTISKFKYHISHVSIASDINKNTEKESYHLIDESNPASLSFSFPAAVNTYESVLLLLGVDSLKNVSGAQSGALDPLNDMFWTWNSGYVMAKMEGKSTQSKVVNNKVEFHIGGFSGVNTVLKNIRLNFPAGKKLDIRAGKTSEVIIEADFNTWWQDPNDIRIVENPICTVPGALAKKIADNYSKMFTIKDIINN